MKWTNACMVIMVGVWLILSNSRVFAFDPCHPAVEHTPRADVTYGAASAVKTPDPVYVPITIDMVERYHLDRLKAKGLKADSFIGMMEVYKDGRILYDGTDISGDIKDSCTKFDDVLDKQTDDRSEQ